MKLSDEAFFKKLQGTPHFWKKAALKNFYHFLSIFYFAVLFPGQCHRDSMADVRVQLLPVVQSFRI
ncbi:hypothetical protein [Komagataeibacter sp. FXV3]|uniref:hypothetical protein n=1 Tax=Komagataeibacter sp. FXV3 TaxID=2608998 RepID=UPI00187B5ECC|nr:hypothetical protein [Komagataeibacter sp. FXV3]